MSTRNHDLAKVHKAAFRQRRKNGLQPIDKPWGWLSITEVKQIALKAYYVATHGLLEDVRGNRFNAQDMRQVFACNLADLMRDLLMAQAVSKGGCWPVTPDTPSYQNYPQIAANLCADLPPTWRPQYPLYALPGCLPGGIGGVAPDVGAQRRGGIKGSAHQNKSRAASLSTTREITPEIQKPVVACPKKQVFGDLVSEIQNEVLNIG